MCLSLCLCTDNKSPLCCSQRHAPHIVRTQKTLVSVWGATLYEKWLRLKPFSRLFVAFKRNARRIVEAGSGGATHRNQPPRALHHFCTHRKCRSFAAVAAQQIMRSGDRTRRLFSPLTPSMSAANFQFFFLYVDVVCLCLKCVCARMHHLLLCMTVHIHYLDFLQFERIVVAASVSQASLYMHSEIQPNDRARDTIQTSSAHTNTFA